SSATAPRRSPRLLTTTGVSVGREIGLWVQPDRDPSLANDLLSLRVALRHGRSDRRPIGRLEEQRGVWSKHAAVKRWLRKVDPSTGSKGSIGILIRIPPVLGDVGAARLWRHINGQEARPQRHLFQVVAEVEHAVGLAE